jgi:glycosyltransferase involved in cell wall biosynthesis
MSKHFNVRTGHPLEIARDPAHRRRPRLLIVGPFPAKSSSVVGGQITACRILCTGCFTEQFDIRTIDSTQKSNPPPSLGVRAWYALVRFQKLARELTFSRPDGVLFFATVGASYIEKGCMAWICRGFRIPQALFIRGGGLIEVFGRSRIQQVMVKACLCHATLFLCQGPSWRRFAVSKLGYPAELCPIIPNWTATEEHLSIGRTRVVGSASPRPRVVFTGWIEREKGVQELLHAALALRAEGHDFEITLVGDGRYMPWVKQFIQENSMQDRIVPVGWKTPDEIRMILMQHDIFVLPSWAEGMPNSLIEAMSARLACICSRVGMVPDFVADRQHALLVLPRQTVGLIDAMRTLITDADMRAALANNGFELASSTFSTDAVIPKLVEAIHKMLEYQRGRRTPNTIGPGSRC